MVGQTAKGWLWMTPCPNCKTPRDDSGDILTCRKCGLEITNIRRRTAK